MKKRFIAALIAILMLMAQIGVNAAEVSWSEPGALDMPFRPADGYISSQNSPSFTWPKQGKSYDIIICADRELKTVLYSKNGVENNFYTFPHTLETEREMYWAVRFHDGAAVSAWSEPRRFIIDKNAYEFTLLSTDELIAKIPSGHPRMYFTRDNLSRLRGYISENSTCADIYNHYKAKADEYLSSGEIPSEPVYDAQSNYVDTGIAMQKLRTDTAKILDLIMTCGFVYQLSGEEKYGRFAIRGIEEVSSWDPKGVTSFVMQDQVHREITYKTAFGYDWCYELMTSAQRAQAEEMFRARIAQMSELLSAIPESPYDSHGWTTIGYIAMTALAAYGDMPEAEGWLRTVLPIYANILPPWSYEDGGWSQGSNYWASSTVFNKEYIDVMNLAGIYNLYKKAWQINETKNFIYAYPQGSWGSFGDQSNYGLIAPEPAYTTMKIAAANNDPYAKWYSKQTAKVYNYADYFYGPAYEEAEEKAPSDLPLSRHFKDIGWVAMHNDLISRNRISLYFKSSYYGTYNHSEADQNDFIIEAFGERLAIKSGYYDSYHSTHNSGFARKTYAHNSVTMDGGKGQLDDNFEAKGKITSYANTKYFDMTTGDASAAYGKRIEKFTRTIIYVRPDQYIVIDDLKVPDGKKAGFEWWLNAEDKISVYSDNSGAKIEKGNAVLDAKLHYPADCTPYYSNIFSGPSLDNIAPGGSYASSKVHKRVWFETPRVNATKMVVTMDVHTKDAKAKYVKKEVFEGYMKLTFENGTTALINLGNKSERINTNEGISFAGEAAVYNDDSIMLVNGSYIAEKEKVIAESENEMTFCINKNELAISSLESDNAVTFSKDNEYLRGEANFIDANGNLTEAPTGFSAEASGNTVTASLKKGEYYISYNEKKESDITAAVNVNIDGVSENYTLPAYHSFNGELGAVGEITVPSGKYIVTDKTKSMHFGNVENNSTANLDKVYVSVSKAEGNNITLTSVPSINITSNQLNDIDKVQSEMLAFVEAENYEALTEGNIYTTRKFMSGGAGVTLMNRLGSTADYKIEVPEDGNYDLYICYVSWEAGGLCKRGFNIGGKYYITELPYTATWGVEKADWRVLEIPTKVYLSKGENRITLEAISGMWNFDWIGIKKAN